MKNREDEYIIKSRKRDLRASLKIEKSSKKRQRIFKDLIGLEFRIEKHPRFETEFIIFPPSGKEWRSNVDQYEDGYWFKWADMFYYCYDIVAEGKGNCPYIDVRAEELEPFAECFCKG